MFHSNRCAVQSVLVGTVGFEGGFCPRAQRPLHQEPSTTAVQLAFRSQSVFRPQPSLGLLQEGRGPLGSGARGPCLCQQRLEQNEQVHQAGVLGAQPLSQSERVNDFK